MKLVTLAHVTLNRIGSANTPQMFSAIQEKLRVVEVTDISKEALRNAVIDLAVTEGEQRHNLRFMQEVPAYVYGGQPHVLIFNVQGLNVQYSTPYATCFVHPALKIGERYFKLEEIAAR